MTRRRSIAPRGLVLLAVGLVGAVGISAQQPVLHPKRIAVFGSSVANGTGDELGREGYTGRLRALLAPRGWEVVNQSRGGDNTVRIAPRFAPAGDPDANTRYLLPVRPRYVLIGLSLGNEGIGNTTVRAEQDIVFAQFETGMRDLIAKSRAHNIIPIVTLCYTRNSFTAVEYEYTRRMNLLINTWEVPSANFLGAIDDGTGKWVDGFWSDALHPNAAGHDELTMTIVPSLFEALERGKPRPAWAGAGTHARIASGRAPIIFEPDSTMHPFAVAFQARAGRDGTVASIGGVALTAASEERQVPAGRGGATRTLTSTRLVPAGRFTAGVGVANGVWTYTSSTGRAVVSGVKADDAWHQLIVSHYTARGETLFFVDGRLAGSVHERLQPSRFVMGGPDASALPPAPATVDLRNVLIYRSALNADEAAALHLGTLLQASLEVYAPLADASFETNQPLDNRAQSMAAMRVGVASTVTPAR
jgi:lysophospholipase L1-like esterase